MTKESIEQITQFKIEPVLPEEWAEYKQIWQEALTTEPWAFGYSLAEISSRSENDWKDIINKSLNSGNNSKIAVAKTGSEISGMAGYFTDRENENTACIYGVYVCVKHRGKGLSIKLMKEILKAISLNKNFTQIELGVNISQIPAIKLYKHFGFEIIRIDKDVKMGDGKLYDEYLMRKILTK